MIAILVCEFRSLNFLLGRAQPVIPPYLYSLFMNIKAWGPQVRIFRYLNSQTSTARTKVNCGLNVSNMHCYVNMYHKIHNTKRVKNVLLIHLLNMNSIRPHTYNN